MTKRISAAQAKAHLSALMARAAFGGEHDGIERRGKPIAALVAWTTWSVRSNCALPPDRKVPSRSSVPGRRWKNKTWRPSWPPSTPDARETPAERSLSKPDLLPGYGRAASYEFRVHAAGFTLLAPATGSPRLRTASGVEGEGARWPNHQLFIRISCNLLRPAPSPALVARLASVPPEQQFISSTTLGELIYGPYRLQERTAALLQRLDESFRPNLPVLPCDAAAARRYGEVRADLERHGLPPELDI